MNNLPKTDRNNKESITPLAQVWVTSNWQWAQEANTAWLWDILERQLHAVACCTENDAISEEYILLRDIAAIRRQMAMEEKP